MKKKLNIVIPLNYDLCQVMAGFFIKKLKKDSIEKKSINLCQNFLFEDTNKPLHFAINFLSNEDFESFLSFGGQQFHPKLKFVKNNLDFLSIFQEELFSKDNNILYSSDWFLEKSSGDFLANLKNKLVDDLKLDVNITIIFEDFFDLIRYRFFSAFRSFYAGFNYFHINEFTTNYEIPRIKSTISSMQKIVSLFGKENFNFIYRKRDLFRDNFPKESWGKILNCLQLEDSDFIEDFLEIDIKKTGLTVNPLFNEYYHEIFEKKRTDPNFRTIMLSEIRKMNQLAEFYRIPLTEKIHFNSQNSEKIVLLNSSLQELTLLPFLPKQVLIKSKKTSKARTFNYFTN